MADDGVLHADVTLEYPFTRTDGPGDRRVPHGTPRRRHRRHQACRRDASSCPPCEYDPATAEPLTEIVEVADVGVVTSWCWNGEPRERQPFDGPFGWALIKLDGADTPMLHAVRAAAPDAMSTGMRVRAVWRVEREGPHQRHRVLRSQKVIRERRSARAGRATDHASRRVCRASRPSSASGRRFGSTTTLSSGRHMAAYLRAMKEKRILGERCPATGQVFVPPRGVTPTSGSVDDGARRAPRHRATSSRSASRACRSRGVTTSSCRT